MSDEILVTKLADELNTTVVDILMRADKLMEERFNEGGHDAIHGMHTGTKRVGSYHRATISKPLADALRMKPISG